MTLNGITTQLISTCCLAGVFALGGCASGDYSKIDGAPTYCNPVDLPYRFQLETPSRREAADPTIVVFHNEYWLFPSKSGGYWHSKDLSHWEFIAPTGLPVEDYAPTVMVMNGQMYWAANDTHELFRTDDPAQGKWTAVASLGTTTYGDPDLFLDDDGKVYMYYGLANRGPLSVTELDPKNGFQALHTENIPVSRDPANRGWENPGDQNELVQTPPWLEGTWMTKHDGKYYLQFAGPGTEFKTYGDGVLVADHPMGPFTYAPYSPFSFKPTGFISGAGHSSTFEGLDHQWWHISTMTISVRQKFERRLGLFPTFFEPDGQMVTDTYLGDYPHLLNGGRDLVGWMLLSYDKSVTASSTLAGHEPSRAVDEDIRTWWSAQTGNPGEWLQVDLGARKRIDAVQVNFADEGSTALGRIQDGYGYDVSVSDDATAWHAIIDRRTNRRDAPDDYEPLPEPVTARYVRITNAHMPAGALFSLGGFRVFGRGMGAPPAPAAGVVLTRDAQDPRHVTVSWQPVPDADFYIVRLGTDPDRLFINYQVYHANQIEIRSLTNGVGYYFTVDAVNENGITKGAINPRPQAPATP